ncbi:MAG: DNA ligase D [Chitinophagaceae bacterium]
MSLTVYNKKRSFKDTPEPSGKKASVDKALRFVVQKHDASRLHYDFRLEMEGVLKSWAVPKGPSMDPSVKRLAMMVEDHPYDYRTFEGIIPKGNYGAGTVIVWDEGTYEPIENSSKNKKDEEKILLHQLFAGSLKFVMHGKKLKGEFALVKIKNNEDNSWLLIKHKDEYATAEDITKKDKSVQSNKTIEQVEKTSDKIWKSNRSSSQKNSDEETTSQKKSASNKTTVKKNSKNNSGENSQEINTANEIDEHIQSLLNKGIKAEFPESLKPMLATLTEKPFDNSNWIFEIKWDGYRAVSFLKNGNINIYSRNNISFNEKFKPVVEALSEWKINAVIDGEIVAVNEEGNADFQQLQNYQKTGKKAKLIYYVFDLLWYEGKNYMELPLIERKEILKNILPEEDAIIKFSDHIHEQGKAFFDLAIHQGVEGVMAKNCNSNYTPDIRTKEWLKIKNNQELEAIICGFTKPRNSRKHFGALILGKYEEKKLIYIGHTGSGFNEKSLNEIFMLLQPLITDECPFKMKPKTNMPVTWIKPQLICEIKFSEWTNEKILRHPIFLGLREDKTAQDEKNVKVVAPPEKNSKVKTEESKLKTKKDTAEKAKEIIDSSKEISAEKNLSSKKSSQLNNILLPDETIKEQTVTINNHKIKLTNLNKLYWPKEKITKRDMLNYYYAIMPYMLPYMKDRPQSLNRHPNGINEPGFYQKDVKGKVAGWLTTYHYLSASSGDKDFLVCTDEASLLYIASLGCIEMNPWHSRVQSPDNPDWCVIDLDPDNNSFDEVIEAAQVVKKVLDSVDVKNVCVKTSGSTGMHIYIPLEAKYDYDQSRLLAELIVTIVHNEIPKFTSLERSPAKRKVKIYLDFLQNRQIQTIAAPYSLRPKPGATVSTPLHWEELKKGLSPKNFTMFNIFDRLKNEGDIFRAVLGEGIDLEKTLEKINSLINQ